MRLTIAYLYYDLLNLYGENGNIKILKEQLEKQKIKTTIKFVTISDELDFDNYDLIYIGAGNEDNQKIVLKHLIKYNRKIKQLIEEDKFFLITGNSIELFGKYIVDINKKKYKALNIFKFIAEEEEFRVKDECIFKTNLIDYEVIGFQYQKSIIKNLTNPLFKVINGMGSCPNDKNEGIIYRNFYATYLIGPLLVKNPELLKFIITKLIKNKYFNYKLRNFDLSLEKEAYDMFINYYYCDKITVDKQKEGCL